MNRADPPELRDPGLLWVRIAPGRPRRFEMGDGTSIERGPDGSLRVASGSVFARGFVLEAMATAWIKLRGGSSRAVAR